MRDRKLIDVIMKVYPVFYTLLSIFLTMLVEDLEIIYFYYGISLNILILGLFVLSSTKKINNPFLEDMMQGIYTGCGVSVLLILIVGILVLVFKNLFFLTSDKIVLYFIIAVNIEFFSVISYGIFLKSISRTIFLPLMLYLLINFGIIILIIGLGYLIWGIFFSSFLNFSLVIVHLISPARKRRV